MSMEFLGYDFDYDEVHGKPDGALSVKDLWALAQLRRLKSQCAYCGKQTDSDNEASHESGYDLLGTHLICRKCWEEFV
jgi:hypothetical protein